MSEQVPHVRATEPDQPGPPGMPPWVKIAGVVVLALVLLFLVLRLAGLGGDHGPGRHMSQGVPVLVGVDSAVPDALRL